LSARLFSKKNIPVFIGNLVSNEKDLKPFVSDTSKADQSASIQYDRACEAYIKGDYAQAKQLFIQAKELDLLRFRAPEAINDVIYNLTSKYQGVHLVDIKKAFEQFSPHGIIGNETIIDHLHPNFLGYAIMSDCFYQELKRQNIIIPDGIKEISFNRLLDRMPVNKLIL